MPDADLPLIAMDWNTFDPWRIAPFTHTFTDHPLLQRDALIDLGKRCRGTNRWYTFSSDARPDTDFDEAAQLFPSSRTAVDSLRAIDDAQAWVLLRHIQVDPTYRALVKLAFDPIVPMIEQKDPGVYFRAGWIFCASPHTFTPFHIDRSHVFLLQVSGTKTVHVWDAHDREVVGDRARDRFHARHDLSLTRWNERYRARAHTFRLAPGMGVYMPLTSPHMVETGDDASTTVSFTYNTAATRRIARAHVMRETLGRLGMPLPAYGRSRSFDGIASLVSSAVIACGGPGGHLPACPSLRHRDAYAVVD